MTNTAGEHDGGAGGQVEGVRAKQPASLETTLKTAASRNMRRKLYVSCTRPPPGFPSQHIL